jgi:hypothetical protein
LKDQGYTVEQIENIQGGIPFMVTQQMKADLAARGFTPEQIRNMPPKAAQAINMRRSRLPRPRSRKGLRTRDTLRLKQPPTADQMPRCARNIAAERQDDVLKGPQPRQLEATPEELGQIFGIEGDLSSRQVPPIPPEKVAVPGRGPLGGGSTPYRMFDISNRERRANVSRATKPDLKTRFFATFRRLLGNVGPGSPSQWAAERIKREALGTVGRMKASLTDGASVKAWIAISPVGSIRRCCNFDE